MKKKKAKKKFRGVALVNRVMSKTYDMEIESTTKKEGLRVSGLPYCPLLDFEGMYSTEPVKWNFEGDFYTKVGTAVHNVLQSFLPQLPYWGKHVYGNWKCPACSKEWQMCFNPGEQAKRGCKKACPKQAEYVEINYPLPGLDSGHSDKLIWDPVHKEWHLWDFKTTGNFLFDAFKKAVSMGFYPSEKYKEQIYTYCVLLKLLYKIDVKWASIIYINREKTHKNVEGEKIPRFQTFTTEFTPELFKKYNARLQKAIKGRRLALKAFEGKGKIEDIYEVRPCHTRKDYLNKMDHAFFAEEKCPHYESGLCFKQKKMISHLKSISDQPPF